MRMMLDVGKHGAFFFDFDGVIVNSVNIKGEAFGSLFTEYGSEIVQKVMDHHFSNGGVSRYDKFTHYYREFLGKEITAEIMEEIDRSYSEKVVEKVIAAPAVDGVMEFLKALYQRQKLMFIVSITPEEEVRYIAQQRDIADLFVEIVGSPRGKGENLQYLLKRYSLAGERAVFFGDAVGDYRAAIENGVTFVGVNGCGGHELDHFSDIMKISDFRSIDVV